MSLLYFFFFFFLSLLSSASTFKITLFADLHYGENPWSDWGPEHDKASDNAMSVLLDQEKPDFVVFLGDIITANNLLIANASFYWDQAMSSTKNRGISWATVFGNHDDMSFVWPTEWFSPSGIPQLRCPPPTSSGSGHGGYGNVTLPKGARIIDITEQPFSIKSWIRLETGDIQSEVDLTSTFKITLFADLHYGENPWSDWGPDHDKASDNAMSVLLDQERPDFVVFLGDIITANNLLIANASFYWDQAMSSTKNRGIPWATVFGNHDDAQFEWPREWFNSADTGIPEVRCPPTTSSGSGEGTCDFKGTTRLELMKGEIERNNLSRSQNGPTELRPSISNYVLPITSSGNPQSTVAFMYFLDSGGGFNPGLISNAQVRWFQNKSQEINPGSMVPELVFWHIPSKAYEEVAPGSGIQQPCVGSINMDRVAAQEQEVGIMDVLSSRPSVKAVFVGHNHGNDWCCPYKKLWLCYARHTGYGGYGTWPKGARIIDITEQPFSIKSWIRMEQGEIHSEVVISS
ncbi:putative inactive purple acid phosphatase 16 [Cinnamomum micranthum f. kanehirae]|uniref:Putative inactive purple acid phosphatase 16 n=1 Tax=Cinnamomum micranthum f. kanehirae TaxID=337451 RepID=A0A443NI40_9MAGN|nr:putative inactive purple acid phosphatase 16 [Cinnamomum micranthum f. kanehirae]